MEHLRLEGTQVTLTTISQKRLTGLHGGVKFSFVTKVAFKH